ncbi:AAA family ATPase [Kitasatospora sp. NPDC058444]|uniref:AAA family ATPase n=1 Tax=Kitasatospora sp. NPDC058444 TaxID=3346504 RepID=UPI003668FDC7
MDASLLHNNSEAFLLIRAEQHEALEYLLALFDGLSSGNGRVVLVSGTLGSGKTQLLHDFSALAAKEGALVLQATGSRAERDLPMGVVEQLLRCAELPSELAAEIPGLVAEAFGDHLGSGPRFERPRAVENETIRRLCNVLLGACDGRPVVVGIDDVHFADAASLQALLYLQRRMRPQRMLMVLNEWDRPQPTLPMFRAELTRAPHSRIQLKPMSERTIRDILERTADHAIEPRLAPAVHRLSGGNPILVHALIEDNHFDHDAHDEHVDAGHGRARTDDAPHVGRSFEMAVLACLYRWEPQILSVASGMAVLREHASPALLGRLLDLDRRCVGQALEILTNAGLANGDEFRHPNVAAAVLASLSHEERTALYTRATRLRRELGMATTDIAAQIVAAGEAGGDWTVPILTDAAEQELASGKTSTAHLYLNLALAAANDDQHLATLRTYVRSTWQTNPSAVAPHTPALREALVEGRLTGRDVVALIRALLWRGDLTTVSAVLAEAEHADLTLGHEDGAELLHVFHWFFGPSFTRSWNLDELCGGGAGTAAGGTRPSAAAAIEVFSRAWSRGGDAESASLAERVLSSCRVDEMPLEAITTAILALADGDQTGRALLWCDELIGHATRRGATTWLAQLKAARADVCLRDGDPGAAAELASDALSLAGEENWGVSIGYPLSVLIQAHLALGHLDDAAKEAGREVPSAMFETVMGIRYLHARGRLALATGRTAEALDDLRTCARRLRVWQSDVSALIPLTASLVEATFRAGDPEAARDLAAGRLEEPSLDDRSRGVLLRLLADHDGDRGRAEPAPSRRAVDGLRASEDRLEPARAGARPAARMEAGSRRVRTGFVPAAQHEPSGLGDGFGYDEQPYAGGAAHLGADRHTGTGLGDEDGLRDGHGLPADDGPRDGVPHAAVPQIAVPHVAVSHAAVPLDAVSHVAGPHVAVPHDDEAALLLGPSPATAPGAASCSVLTGLSRAELRVARLAAQGDSNREISDKLWITVSTVEQHLTRIYRKLNLSGRAGLADLLRAELLPADAPVFRDAPGGSTRIGPEVGFHTVELVGCAASSVEVLEAVGDAAGLGADGVAVG